MLDSRKHYYVTATMYPESVLVAWANENGMTVIGEIVALPCGAVYELGVRGNDDLSIKFKLFSTKHRRFMNRERCIGSVKYGSMGDNTDIVVYPEIRDR